MKCNCTNASSPVDVLIGYSFFFVLCSSGPPGVGKTALSRHLTAAYGLTPLSSGVLIRSEIARATPLGVQIKDIVASGGLVADELVLALVEKEIERLRTNNTDWPGVILDGFPRTLPQARMLDRPDCPIPPLSPMIYVHMKESILAERREGRRLCPVCGATYNMNPIDHDGYKLTPRVPDHADQTTCSRDNATLVRREDDKPDVAAHRMAAFRNESLPMARYYSAQGKLISIEKRFGAKKVFRAIRADIERLMAQQRLENERRAEERPQKLPEELDRQEDELRRVRGPESGLTGAGTEEEEETTQLVENDNDNDSSSNEEQEDDAKEEQKDDKDHLDQAPSKKEEEKGEKEQQPTAHVQGKQRSSSGGGSKQPKAQEGA
jgi:adenylate kinase